MNRNGEAIVTGKEMVRLGDGRTAILDEAMTAAETQEQRARRLFDEMARNIGREAVNHLKTMYPEILSDRAHQSKSWERSLTNSIRNDINWRMRPLLMAMIAMHREWEEEREA